MSVHILCACMQCPQRPETGVKGGHESPSVWVLGTEQHVLCPAEPSISPSFVICSFYLMFECYLIFQKVDQIHRFVYTSIVNLLVFIIEYCYLIFNMNIESLYYSTFLF